MRGILTVATAAAVGLYLAGHAGAAGHSHYAAVRYAQEQIGKPYIWGGAGPNGFDCSGLAMRAEEAAGIDIDRTTFEQWDELRHIPESEVRPGDLVYFAGGDGSMTSPGHVGIVENPKRDLMIVAPEPGQDVQQQSYAGASDLVGFAAP